MPRSPARAVRLLGIVSGTGVAAVGAVYLLVLIAGLATLPAPDAAIGDPWFTAMEALILLLVPFLLGLSAAVRGTELAPRSSRAALVFMAAALALTSVVHLSTLAVGRGPAGAFGWPALPYALDIFAWDGLFGVAVLLTAPAFREEPTIRHLLIASGALALAGWIGPITGVMALRIIGVAGYAVLFPVAAALIARWFRRRPIAAKA
ncbi:hypothetical protein HZY97_19465 [Sphingomonas sp. R-74633]|uniref:hypothetical protein n=1 Tax=Sphingomonas sp. R-74633 TaxID=2751188 RepID=UPI0015D3EDF3|nr:hypothetical protein [Sphingomonas sp. R-74633]NYT42962.1 hypothetical protein [Sphingomonas sp. R-74633]